MSGVIDNNGQQWEHCNECGKFVKIQELAYQKPTDEFKYGRDLCPGCADAAENYEGADVDHNPGTITLSLEPDYKGNCGRCSGKAKHEIWCQFDTPIAAVADLPEIKGCWHFVCDGCLKPDDVIREAT